MERGIHKVYDADKLFYYFFTENESCNLVLRLVLCSRIDKKLLKEALNKTLCRYPNFRQTPVVDAEGYLYTRDNEAEAEIYPYDSHPVNLGTKETDGYLFRVMVQADTLWISVFHAVCDGRGFLMFARSLLYEYFTMTGEQIPDPKELILTQSVPADFSEMSDPLDISSDAVPAANLFKPTGEEDIFLLPDDPKKTDRCSYYGLFRYVLNTPRLLQLAREADATVDTYVHLLMARVIHDNYDVGEKKIAGMGAVDLRPYYDSRYLQNMRELFWIYYTEEMFGLSDRDAADIIARQFKDKQLTRDNFDGVIKESAKSLPEMLGFPITYDKGLAFMRERIWEAPELLVTYFTTNLVCFAPDGIFDSLVKEADIYGPAIFRCPGIFLMTHGNETTVNLTQRSFKRDFPGKLKAAFEKEGLLIRDELGSWFENDKIRIDKFLKI